MFIGILVSIIESVGNYISCAKISGVTPPPRHAINRGIAIEGVASMFAGLCGSGNGTTSYSENIAAIGVTRVRIFLEIKVNTIFLWKWFHFMNWRFKAAYFTEFWKMCCFIYGFLTNNLDYKRGKSASPAGNCLECWCFLFAFFFPLSCLSSAKIGLY